MRTLRLVLQTLVAAVIIGHTNAWAARCQDGQFVLFVINGIWFDPDEADNDRTLLSWQLEDELGCSLLTLPAVNRSENTVADVYETMKQLEIFDDEAFWFVVLGLDSITRGDPSAVVNRLSDQITAFVADIDAGVLSSVMEEDIEAHLAQYAPALASDRHVILLGHSQGNLFSNIEYGRLLTQAPSNAAKVTVVGVATPAPSVAGDSTSPRYTTLKSDWIWHIPRALPANVPQDEIGPCGVVISPLLPAAWKCHKFGKYLKVPSSWNQIASHIRSIVAGQPPVVPSCALSADPTVLLPGQSSTLLWTTGGSPTEASIDSGVGAVEPSGGSTNVAPAITTTYTLAVVNAAGSGQCSVEVQVIASPGNLVPTAGFTMTSGGQSATNGQTLNVTVPVGGAATVAVVASDCSPGPGVGCSYDPDGTIASRSWTVDGTPVSASGESLPLEPEAGTHTVTLTVTDSLGATSQPVQGTINVTEGAQPLQDLGVETVHTLTGYGSAFAILRGNDGNLYGTTTDGGDPGCGAFFRLSSDGAFAVVRALTSADGCVILSLIQAIDGTFWGTTEQAIVRLDASGNLSVVKDFFVAPGVLQALSKLVEGSDGNFYGFARTFGSTSGSFPIMFYRLAQDGEVTPLYILPDNVSIPRAGVILTDDGMFYGTTETGGDFGSGMVFRLSTTGAFETLYSFEPGAFPNGGLTETADGYFYGTTRGGGDFGYGSVFRMSAVGELATIHSFSGATAAPDAPNGDGLQPVDPPVQAVDGNFYGSTQFGAASGNLGIFGPGTLFGFNAVGDFATLFFFNDSFPDGVRLSQAFGLVAADGAADNTLFYGIATHTALDGQTQSVIFRATPASP